MEKRPGGKSRHEKPAILAGMKERISASGPGVMVAPTAMVMALAGAAFAAIQLNGTQKKELKRSSKVRR